MSKLLMSEHPLMIIPSLAVKIGLNEAVVLQQIHFWLLSSSHRIDGQTWIYNTYKEWQKQFPFWSESTIKRIIHSLEDQGFLISANHNQLKMDKTKWYTIDYNKMEELGGPEIETTPDTHLEPTLAHDEPTDSSDSLPEETNLTQAIPERTSEITSEKKNNVAEVIHYLNRKINADYKPTTHKTQEHIKARIREGFTLEDFKKVIDIKTAEWLHHPQMSKFLRPATLFGSKFESYLNQKSCQKTLNEEDFDLDDEAGDI